MLFFGQTKLPAAEVNENIICNIESDSICQIDFVFFSISISTRDLRVICVSANVGGKLMFVMSSIDQRFDLLKIFRLEFSISSWNS